ncbi:phage adaptor protein [Ensifer adhaerens]|uniref:phage adaptor protein n=1 Tax=Ensifer adhaerens TaxID=106592 RepID=UPI003CFF6ABF
MSSIADYAALLIDAGEYSGRNDIAHLFPRFVGLAELKLNRMLRVGDMEATAAIAVVDGDAPLPADFVEARQMLSASGRPIRAMALQQLAGIGPASAGGPLGYAVVGNRIKAFPTGSYGLTMTYYGRIPPLSAAGPTNWLLQKAPDVYLYGLVEEIAIWERDAGKAAAAQQLKTAALAGLGVADERARWGDAQMTVGGVTP